ncbi:MAG: hypothetical protein ACRD35_00385 [Candidatus Acidiferrales bacterium]
MIKRVLLVVVCLLTFLSLAALPAAAQAEKGDKEVLVNGTFTRFWDGEAFNFGIIAVNLGYYATDHVQVGAGMNFIILTGGASGGGGSISETNVGFNALIRYNFSTEGRKAVPYVGAEYFMFTHHEPVNLSFIRGHAGVKYFFTRNVAIDFNAGYARNVFADSAFGKVHVVDTRVGIAYVF